MQMSSIKFISILMLILFGAGGELLAQANFANGIVYEENKNNPIVCAVFGMINRDKLLSKGEMTKIQDKCRIDVQ